MTRPTEQPMTATDSDDAHDKDPATVWCETCQHVHIARIPGVTWRCRDCGWGQWSEADAVAHAASQPGHEPYRVGHWIPERIRRARREARVEVDVEWLGRTLAKYNPQAITPGTCGEMAKFVAKTARIEAGHRG